MNNKKTPAKRSKLLLAFVRPTPQPPMTSLAKYQALASATPDALLFVNETIEYLYDVEMRRYPHLFAPRGGGAR
jgi:hypothetical protein